MKDYSSAALIEKGVYRCACGKIHKASIKASLVAPGAVAQTAVFARRLGGNKAFVLADENTFRAAGTQVLSSLETYGMPYTVYRFPAERPEPDETTVGSAVLHFDYACNCVLAIGSGVINDTAKIVAKMTGLPLITVATAPSMDGYASSTSSVIRDRLKVSVNSRCPDAVLGDLDVLKNAPRLMLLAGLGDMLAKYVSIAEWQIGQLVTGEYYCPEVANMIRSALRRCVNGAEGLLNGDDDAVRDVMDGLIVAGIAADWAGVSRPVSGTEHYFSHIWDMRAAALGTPSSLHGIQCAIGTVKTLKGYERLRTLLENGTVPEPFDKDAWLKTLGVYMQGAGGPMIENARASALYDPARQAVRQQNIQTHLTQIVGIIDTLPSYGEVSSLLRLLGAPVSPEEIGIPEAETAVCFKATKDVRDKYILSSLAFDMGVLDQIAEKL